ncbi:MAG: hypothetical protein JXA68_11265, partial [Ignavibacteriales bacterium]|nr:hypothetical protein [Ignavibacteriales bacterium]
NNYDNNTLNNSVNQAGTGTENERAIAESSPNNSVENIYRGKASEISGIKLFGYGDVKSTLAANPDLAKKLTVGGIGFENVSCHFLSLVNSLKLLGANIDLKSSLQALIDNSGGFRTGQLITNPRSFMNAVLTANNVAATSKYEVISNPGNNYTSLISSGNSALIRGSDIHHSNYQFYNNGSWYQVNSTGYLQAAGFVSNPSYIGIISLNWK